MDIFNTMQKAGQAISKTITPEKQRRDEPLGEKREPLREPIKREQKGGIFGSRPKISRFFMIQRFRRAPDRVEGGGKLTKAEKITLAEEVFPQKEYGYYINQNAWQRRVSQLVKSERRVINPTEKMKLRTKIKFLNSIKKGENKN